MINFFGKRNNSEILRIYLHDLTCIYMFHRVRPSCQKDSNLIWCHVSLHSLSPWPLPLAHRYTASPSTVEIRPPTPSERHESSSYAVYWVIWYPQKYWSFHEAFDVETWNLQCIEWLCCILTFCNETSRIKIYILHSTNNEQRQTEKKQHDKFISRKSTFHDLSIDIYWWDSWCCALPWCQLGAPGKATHEATEEAIEQTDKTGRGEQPRTYVEKGCSCEEVCIVNRLWGDQ